MTDAYIYDAVRTPRGRGKKDGALHEVTPIRLAAGALKALQQRNTLDTAQVDDVVLGCVEPTGDQGADIARLAVLYADFDQSLGRCKMISEGNIEYPVHQFRLRDEIDQDTLVSSQS